MTCAILFRLYVCLLQGDTIYSFDFLQNIVIAKKKQGFSFIKFDLLLVAKRSFKLDEIFSDFRQKKSDDQTATKHILPLIVMVGANCGVTTLYGNEINIREFYRQ